MLSGVTRYLNKLIQHHIGARVVVPYFFLRNQCLGRSSADQQLFQTNIFVYDLQEMEEGDITARLVRRSPYRYQETMNLNLYEQHFNYVNDMEKYSHSFLCSKCDRLWKHVGTLVACTLQHRPYSTG